jgi:hypothetical protein
MVALGVELSDRALVYNAEALDLVLSTLEGRKEGRKEGGKEQGREERKGRKEERKGK